MGTGVINVPDLGDFHVDDSFGQLPPDQQRALVAQMVAQVTGQVPAPGSPNAPSGSLLTAAGQSVAHGLPAAAASGLSGFTRWIENVTGRNDPTALGNAAAEDAYAARQRLTMAQNYQRPDSVAPSIVAGLAEGQDFGDKLARAGQAALYGAAENAGPGAASLAVLPAVAAFGAPAAAVGTAGEGLLALSGVRDAKARAGLDPNQVSTGDMVNAAGQTALNMIPGGSGIVAKGLAGVFKGAAAPVMNDTGALLQGGAVDPRTLASDALDGGVEGGLTTGAMDAFGAAKNMVGAAAQRVTDPLRAGGLVGPLASYQRQMGAWNDAVQASKDAIVQHLANPPVNSPAWQDQQNGGDGLGGAGLQETAEAAAVANGAVKPDMTPDVQKAAARLALLQLFQQRKATEDQRGSDGKADANTFKSVGDDMGNAVVQIANRLRDNDLIDGDLHKDILRANAEAGKHNRNLGEGGQEAGYVNTAVDNIQQAQLDPEYKDLLTAILRVRDDAASNGLLGNTRGPLEKNAGIILPMLTGAAGLGGFMEGGAIEGLAGVGLLKPLVNAVGRSWLRKLDQVTGLNQPQALDGSAPFLRAAAAQGLQPSVTGNQIVDALTNLQIMQSLPPGGAGPGTPAGTATGPRGPAGPAAPPAPPTPPVTTPGRPYAPAPGQPGPMPPPAPPPRVVTMPPPAPPAPPPVTAAPSGPPEAPPQAPAVQGVLAARMAAQAASASAPPASPEQAPAPIQAVLVAKMAAQAASAPPAAPASVPAGPTVDPLRQAALLAQAQQAAQAQEEAAVLDHLAKNFPTDRRAWSGAMAQTLGVQHDPMMAAIKTMAAGNDVLQRAITQDNIPNKVMRAITDRVAGMRDAGQIPLAPQGAAVVQGGPGGSSAPGLSLQEQMRLASYQASIAQENAAANAVRQQAPAAVAAIEAQSTVKARQAALQRYLRGIADPAERAKQAAILTPLTLFGSKADPEVSPAATAAKTPPAWILPGLPMNATNDNRN